MLDFLKPDTTLFAAANCAVFNLESKMVDTCEALVTYSAVARESESESEFEENKSVGDKLRGKIREELESRGCVFYQKIETTFSAEIELNQMTKSHLRALLRDFFGKLKNKYDSNDQAEIYVVAMAKDLGLVEFSL